MCIENLEIRKEEQSSTLQLNIEEATVNLKKHIK